MKKYICFFLSVFLFLGCSGDKKEDDIVKEKVTVSHEKEKLQIGAERNTEQLEYAEEWNVIVDNPTEIHLQYIPEMGYCKSIEGGGIYRPGYCDQHSSYAYWKNWLIIGDEVYRRQESGIYKKEGEHYLYEMLGVEHLYEIKQLQNVIVMDEQISEKFYVFNLDTWEKTEIDDWEDSTGIDFEWYLFEGKIYYMPDDKNSIRRIDISSGKNEEIFKLDEEASQIYEIFSFSVRDDGVIMAILRGGSVNPDNRQVDPMEIYTFPCHHEYWQIEPGEDGFVGQKIGETDTYVYLSCIEFNQYGFFQYGTYPTSDGKHCLGKYICLKADGDIEEIYTVWQSNDQFYLAEDGYYLWDCIENPKEMHFPDNEKYVDAITKYNFNKDKVKTYRLIKGEMLSEGWCLSDLIIHGEQATAFYANESKNYLYISQVSLE